jgi:hypothetical protein
MQDCFYLHGMEIIGKYFGKKCEKMEKKIGRFFGRRAFCDDVTFSVSDFQWTSAFACVSVVQKQIRAKNGDSRNKKKRVGPFFS